MMSNNIQKALELVKKSLADFADRENFWDDFELAFGTNYDRAIALNIKTSLASKTIALPSLEVLSDRVLGNAQGAFAGSNGKIYLSESLIDSGNIQQISAVILEEFGHWIDFHINAVDRPGDEGELFAAIVQGENISQQKLAALKAEDDSAVITVDSQTIQIEQATVGVNAGFDLIGLTRLRNDTRFAGIDGSGFTVAVIDTGLDATHPDISGNFVGFADFVDGGSNPTLITNINSTFDLDRHGTHVAGTVGSTNENIGVATDVGLISLQVFTSSPDGGVSGAQNNDINEALQWVLNNHQQYKIVAVNMSLGGGLYTSIADGSAANTTRNDLIRSLEQAGVTIVSAAGNSYQDYQYQNSGSPGIISTLNVGAVWEDNQARESGFANLQIPGADRVAVFSQRINTPNTIFAPGVTTYSTTPGGKYDRFAGTSMASPHVAGTVALMQEAAFQFGGRLLSTTEVADILRSTADTIFDGDDENDDILTQTINTNTSYRRMNVYNAISEIKRRFDTVSPPPPGGGAGDANGTIAGAILGPSLNGTAVAPILGSIGIDGENTQVGDKDVDIIRFEVVVPGTVTIELGAHPTNPNNFDTYLRLFNAAGTQLAANDDISSTNGFSRLDVNLAAGVYYAAVSGFSNINYNPTVAGSGVAAATGNYALQLSLSNTDFDGLLKNAQDITLGTILDPYDIKQGSIGNDDGKIVGTGDVDLFKVIVPDNGTLFIDIDTPFETGYVDSYLRIFDANGNQLVFSDDDLSRDINSNFTEFTDSLYPNLVFQSPTDRTFYQGHTSDSFIFGGVERGEVYYIGVSDFANQNYNLQNLNDRSTAGTGGSYDLNVQFLNNDRNGSISQAVSTLSLPITSQSGVLGTDTDPQTGQIFQVGNLDVDFVKIRSATAGILEVDVDSYQNTSFTTPVDTVLSIFDVQGKLLANNDDTTGKDPLLQYQIAANTDYYVAISGYGNSNFDPFMLGSGSAGDTGQYIFKSRLLSTNQGITSLSNNAINNPLVQNQPLSIGSSVNGNIGSDNNFTIGSTDIDLYSFIANSTGKIKIRTNTYSEFSADTFLRFFNSSGTEIAFNDDENTSTSGSYLEVQVTAGTQYYIGVNGYSAQARNYNPLTGGGAAAGSQGDYILSVTAAQAPVINITPVTSTIVEGLTSPQSLNYTVTLSQSSTQAVTVQYTTVNGTAQAGTDYTTKSGTLTFNPGVTSQVINIPILNDAINEANETFTLTLTNPSNATLGATAIVTTTITDTLSATTTTILPTNVENLTLTGTTAISATGNAGDNILTGNTANNTLTGGAGNDTLNGAGGIDILVGGLGNDLYVVDTITDTITEIAAQGTDKVESAVTFSLAALVNLEDLTLTGTTAINATGNAGDNTLTGNTANNTLTGAAGNDTYIFNTNSAQGIDVISEAVTGGNDTLDFTQTAAAVNINLGLTTTQTVNANLKLVIPVISLENVFGGGGNDRIAGNSLNNSLYGGNGDDRIFGAAGNDFILGEAGNDSINGGDGNDTIYGQAGNDLISGGAGSDIFAYNGSLSGAITANGLFGLDTISDFTSFLDATSSAKDKISLSKSTFSAITSGVGAAMGGNFIAVDDDSLVATQSAAIVYSLNSGSLFYNQNGAAAGFGTNGGEFATLLSFPTLVGTDFTVVA